MQPIGAGGAGTALGGGVGGAGTGGGVVAHAHAAASQLATRAASDGVDRAGSARGSIAMRMGDGAKTYLSPLRGRNPSQGSTSSGV